MAEKTLGIEATLSGLDDVLTDLGSLVELLGQLPGSTTLNIDTQGLDQIQSDSQGAEVSLEQIGEASSFANNGINDVTQSLQEASAALGGINSDAWVDVGNDIKPTKEWIQEAVNATSDFNSELMGIDVSAFNEISTSVQGASVSLDQVQEAASHAGSDLSGMDVSAREASDSVKGIDSSNVQELSTASRDASSSLDDAANSTSVLETAANALIAVGLGAWLAEATNAAGAWEDSINVMAVTLGGSVDNADAIQAQYSGAMTEMSDETGRSTLTIRSYISMMANAGVTSADVLESSFEGIAATSVRTTTDIGTIETAFKRVVSTGTIGSRQLVAMGLTTSDIYKATGMSVEELSASLETMDETQRAAMLSSILNSKNAENANEAYKVSWEHTIDVLNRAWNAISRIVGGFVLPVVTPVINATTDALIWLADAVKSIPGPIQNLIGVIILVGAGLVAWYTVIAPLVAILGTALAPILSTISALFTTLTIDAVAVGEAAAFAGAGMAEGAIGMEAVGASAGLLGISLGPVGWAIIAITAAVVAAIIIWQTWGNEISKFAGQIASGDWGGAAQSIVSSFSYIGGAIYSSLVNAGQQIWSFFAALPGMIGGAATAWVQMGGQFLNWIVQGLLSLSSYLMTTLTGMLTAMATDGGAEGAGTETGQSAGQGLIGGLIQWLQNNWPQIESNLTILFMKLPPLILQVIGLLMAVVGLYIYQQLTALGNNIKTRITSFFTQLGTKARTGAQQFVNSIYQFLITLPARMWTYLWQGILRVTYWGAYLVGLGIRTGIQFVDGVVSFLINLPGQIWSFLSYVITMLPVWADQMYQWAVMAGSNFVNGVISFIVNLPGTLWGILLSTLSYISSFAGSAYGYAASAGSSIYNGLISAITGLPGAVWNELMNIGSRISSAGGTLYSMAQSLGQNIYNGLLAGLGIHSPGYMYYAIVGEVENMDNALSDNNLGSTSQSLGKNIASVFMSSASLKSALPNLSGINLSGLTSSSTSSSTSTSETTVNVNHKHVVELDLKNAPESVDTDKVSQIVIDTLLSRDGQKALDKTYGGLASRINKS